MEAQSTNTPNAYTMMIIRPKLTKVGILPDFVSTKVCIPVRRLVKVTLVPCAVAFFRFSIGRDGTKEHADTGLKKKMK